MERKIHSTQTPARRAHRAIVFGSPNGTLRDVPPPAPAAGPFGGGETEETRRETSSPVPVRARFWRALHRSACRALVVWTARRREGVPACSRRRVARDGGGRERAGKVACGVKTSRQSRPPAKRQRTATYFRVLCAWCRGLGFNIAVRCQCAISGPGMCAQLPRREPVPIRRVVCSQALAAMRRAAHRYMHAWCRFGRPEPQWAVQCADARETSLQLLETPAADCDVAARRGHAEGAQSRAARAAPGGAGGAYPIGGGRRWHCSGIRLRRAAGVVRRGRARAGAGGVARAGALAARRLPEDEKRRTPYVVAAKARAAAAWLSGARTWLGAGGERDGGLG